MGFRFRKSIKIAPGVRVNLGKKSASVSFGGKGIRHTVSTTGRQTSTVGIPGSGLYYTKSSSMKQRHSSNNSYSNPSLEVDNFNNAISYITSLHKECDYCYDWNEINSRPSPLNNDKKGINEFQAQKKFDNYTPGFLAKCLGFLKSSQLEKLEKNIIIAREKDMQLYEGWKELSKLSELILKNDLEAYTSIMEEIGLSEECSHFISSFNFRACSPKVMLIEFDINIYDIIPETYKTVTNAGNLSVRKYTKTNYYQIVQQYVSSLSLRVARNALGLLPLQTVIINVQVNELDTQTGNMVHDTILSVKIDRSALQSLNLDSIVPFDALNNFEHNVRFLKTKGFQPVEKIM